MIPANIQTKIGDSKLLTRENGEIPTNTAQKRQIAIYSNGLAVMTEDFRYTAEFKVLSKLADQTGNPIREEVMVPVTVIETIYNEAPSEDGEVHKQLELERQQKVLEIFEKAALKRATDIRIRILPSHTELSIRLNGRMLDAGTVRAEEGLPMIQAIFSVASDLGSSMSPYAFMQGALTGKSRLLPPKVEMIRLQYSPGSDGRGALVMRLKYMAPSSETEIDHLGYNDRQIQDIATMRRRTNGAYIMAGKVSSGKSTTLQRVLNKMFLEKNREISIFTIEEPIELDIPSAIQVPAKKGPKGEDGFSMAIHAALRSDPNIIVLGEVRTGELASLAIQAVMTGHALWTTVHAGSALGILDRFLDLGVPNWKLIDPNVIRGLVYQRLSGVMCRHCRITFREGIENGSLSSGLAYKLSAFFEKSLDELYVRGPGCDKCNSGLSGRTVVAETVLTDPQMLEYFGAGDRTKMRKYWLTPKDKKGLGGIPVLHHALSKVGAGICDINEVEEEVDLFEQYEKHFMILHDQMLEDVRVLEEREAMKLSKGR